MNSNRIATVLSIALAILLASPISSSGAQKFGMIFDLKGNVSIKKESGSIKQLDRAKDILSSLRDGDTITVGPGGKVLIVSSADNTGYELLAGSSAVIKNGAIEKVSGTMNQLKGYKPSSAGGASGPIGAIVLRSTTDENSCINTLSPRASNILYFSPELRWDNKCGTKTVTLKVFQDRNIVYETASKESSVKLRDGLLKSGVHYRWIVEAGQQGHSGGSFSMLDQKASKSILQMQSDTIRADSMPERLTYIFTLRESNLNDMADAEIAKLVSEFPDNENFKALK